VIPKISLPEGKLCRLEELELSSECPSQSAAEKREDYAKMALLMFYPFRSLEDLLINGSFWKLFDQEREKHFNNQDTTFWTKGFEILRNIQDRMTLEKKMRHPDRAARPPRIGGRRHPEKQRHFS
jgi:hypothetical protein